ncbi:MAG: hypothetical protein QCI82_10825 [Candidatus Thermoplasmatota archaeon]|nr:hypothetical protein [Candidatus Thermoplasmatota archaeon]
MQATDRAISNEIPRFSLGGVVRTIAQKGPLKAMDDPEQGPHVHLTLLIITILVVSGIIIAATSLFL